MSLPTIADKPSVWAHLAAEMRDRWPQSKLTPKTIAQWGEDVADLPAEHVRAAVEVLARTERQFAPQPGEIRAEVTRLRLDVPDWGEVLGTFRLLASTPKVLVTGWEEEVDEDGHEVARRLAVHPRQEAIAAAHPLVGVFIELVTWASVEVAVGIDGDGSDEARLRVKWEQFVRRLERDESMADLAPVEELSALQGASERRAPRRLGNIEGLIGAEAEERPAIEAAPEDRAPSGGARKIPDFTCSGCGLRRLNITIDEALVHMREECPQRAQARRERAAA